MHRPQFYLYLTLLLGLVGCSETIAPEAGTAKTGPDGILQKLELTDSLLKSGNIKSALNVNGQLLPYKEDDTLKAQIFKQRIGLLRKNDQIDSALFYIGELKLLGERLKDSSIIANAHYRFGFYLRSMGQPEASAEHYYKARDIYQRIKDTTQAAQMSTNLGNLLKSSGNLGAAERIGVSALNYDPENVSGEHPKLLNLLAITASARKLYPEARYWYAKSLSLATTPKERITLFNNMANAYRHEGDTDRALELMDSLYTQTPWQDLPELTDLRALVLANLGQANLATGKADPLSYYQQAAALYDQGRDQGGKELVQRLLAEYYSEANPLIARKHADSALVLARQIKDPELILKDLALLITLSPQPKQYATEYTAVSDSLLRAKERSAEGFARLEYDTEQNRSEKLRLENLSIQQQLELTSANRRNWILGLSLLGGVGIAMVGYHLIRERNKLTLLQASIATENRISKKIHDELANDVFNTMTYVQHAGLDQQDSRDKLLDQLEDIYERTRNISRENASVHTGASFGESMSVLLSRFQGAEVQVITRGFTEVNWGQLSIPQQQTIYRVLQELLVNMKKHSGASVVLCTFTSSAKALEIQYKDNGQGIQSGQEPSGGGLSNIRERLAQLGGSMAVESQPGKGFGATISLPVKGKN